MKLIVILRDAITLSLFVILFSGCKLMSGNGGTLEVDQVAGGKTYELLPAFGTISDASSLELQNSNTEVSMKVVGAGANGDACPHPGSASSDGYVGSNGGPYNLAAFSVTPTTSYWVYSVIVYMGKSGAVPGQYRFKIVLGKDYFGTTYADPNGSSLGETNPIDYSSLVDGDNTFTFNTPVQLNAGTQYFFMLTPQDGWTPPGAGNSFYMWSTTGCVTSNMGSLASHFSAFDSWEGSLNPKTIVTLKKPAYSTGTPNIKYSVDSGRSTDWHFNTFITHENPNSESGTITYDVAVNNDGSESYPYTDQTADQVKNLGILNGQYFLIRAKFHSNGAEDVSLGKMTVYSLPH